MPAVNASTLSCDMSFGIEMCCVNGGWFSVSMSGGQTVSVCGGCESLTLVLAFDAPLEPVRGLAEAVLVHLCMDELQYGNQAVFAFRVLRVS